MRRRAIIGTAIGASLAFAVAAPVQWVSAVVANLNRPTPRNWAEAVFWTGWYTLAGAGVGAAIAYATRPRGKNRADPRRRAET